MTNHERIWLCEPLSLCVFSGSNDIEFVLVADYLRKN